MTSSGCNPSPTVRPETGLSAKKPLWFWSESIQSSPDYSDDWTMLAQQPILPALYKHLWRRMDECDAAIILAELKRID